MGDPAAPLAPESVASAFGFDPAGGEVVRSASRVVMRFPDATVRTFAVPAPGEGTRQEAAVAALLADAGVPATRHLAGPIDVEGWTVTAWRELEVVAGAPLPSADAVGALAHRLHSATAGLDPRGLPRCDPLAAARAQLQAAAAAGRTTDAELALLHAHAQRLDEVWAAAVAAAARRPGPEGEDPLAAGAVVHGDLHPGNVVTTTTGPVLVDLELAGWGPCGIDAAPTLALVRWYGRPDEDLRAFDGAYGGDLTREAARRGLDEVWGLWSTAWAIANRHRSPTAEAEARVRIASWADPSSAELWTLR